MVEGNELAAGADVVAIGLEIRSHVEVIDPELFEREGEGDKPKLMAVN